MYFETHEKIKHAHLTLFMLSLFPEVVKKVRGRKAIMALNIPIIVYMNATDYNRKLRLLLHWNRTEDMFKD